jgi:hypothetical protein
MSFFGSAKSFAGEKRERKGKIYGLPRANPTAMRLDIAKAASTNKRKGRTAMKGEGPKRERETIINFNEEDETATLWTASGSL